MALEKTNWGNTGTSMLPQEIGDCGDDQQVPQKPTLGSPYTGQGVTSRFPQPVAGQKIGGPQVSRFPDNANSTSGTTPFSPFSDGSTASTYEDLIPDEHDHEHIDVDVNVSIDLDITAPGHVEIDRGEVNEIVTKARDIAASYVEQKLGELFGA